MLANRLHLRLGYEFFTSLNIAAGFVVSLEFGYDGIVVPVLRLEDIIYYNIGLKGAGGAVSGYLALFLYIMLITALLLLLMEGLRRSHLMERILVYGAGFFALGVAPAGWVYITRHRADPTWCLVEIAFCFLLAVWYLWPRSTMPTSAAVLAACLHYWIWGQLYSYWFWAGPPVPPKLLMFMAGVCACVLWGMYITVTRASGPQVVPDVG